MKRAIVFICACIILSSCSYFNPSQMLRTGSGYKYSTFPSTQVVQEYTIAKNDEIVFRIFTNSGEKIIDPVIVNTTNSSTNSLTFHVENDGQIKLPIIGDTPIEGLTIREAEKMLEEKYTAYFNKPYVQLQVTNNRVIIFPGGQGGVAKAVPLNNANTTLFEALALSGGIVDGKAKRIKLIRGDLKNPQVYLIDLSTIKGMQQANLVLQANDIIYVEPRNRAPQRIISEVLPFLTFATTILVLYELVTK